MPLNWSIPLVKLGGRKAHVRVKLTRRGVKTRAKLGWFSWTPARKRRR